MSSKELDRQRLQREYDRAHNQLERNVKGQFATPNELANSIVNDALGRIKKPRTLLEPACGTGSFISAVQKANPEISITGIEKDVDVYGIARHLWSSDSISIMNCDFFDEIRNLHGYDMLVTNPPYTRHHHISQANKARYNAIVEELTGIHLSQLAGLHAYFILAGTSLLNPGGIASWLIPSELFSVNYGKEIKDYITSNVKIERIHFFENNDLQFGDALVSSCVLVLRKRQTRPEDTTLITSGNLDQPSQSSVVPINKLLHIAKWQHFFNEGSFSVNTHIGDYFNVKRGLSTGAESFYARKRSEWHAIGINDDWLTPVLPAPRFMHDSVVIADSEGWPVGHDRALLSIPADCPDSELPRAVCKYLETCPDKVRNSYTAQHRRKWYSIERRDPAPIVCTYMSRSNGRPFRFVRNRSKAVVTTAYLCLYPRTELSDEELDDICTELNKIAPSLLINSGREYGGGLRKLEPKELLSVPFSSLVTSNAERQSGRKSRIAALA